MLCAKPIGVNGVTVGCGHCGACIANRRRLWTGRMLLEQQCHPKSAFVTLTYKVAPPFLMPRHLQLYLKRLRYFAGPFRFYGVGEYGSLTGRAHWHVGVFGLGMEDRDYFAKAWKGHLAGEVSRVPDDSYGGVHVGELNHDSATYLCKYMCKDDGAAQIVRMSRNPGIGKLAVDGMAVGLLQRGGSSALARVGDVPSESRIGGKRYPLGVYMRRALREAVGWAADTPVEKRREVAFKRSLETPEEIRLRSRKRAATEINQRARVRRKSVEKL